MDNNEPAPRKPLIFADDPLKGMDDSAEFVRANWDASYVGGYSEDKRENDLRRSKGEAPKPIPRLQWIRISDKKGEDVGANSEGMFNWRQNLGYRAMGQDDLENYGYRMPDSAHVAPDGTIRRGDLALFYVPPERAERNRRIEDAQANRAKTRQLEPDKSQSGLDFYQDDTQTERGLSPTEAYESDLPIPKL
jgi:hypothetical protein